MRSKKTTQQITLISLVLGSVLLLAVNLLGQKFFKSTRLDFTDGKLYTLSQGTRNILKNIDEPVTLRLFLSKHAIASVPGFSDFATRVNELLQEYKRVAGSRLKLQIIDPEPFSENEDRAVGYGLQGAPLDADTSIYFGLVGTNSLEDQQVIPFFAQERERLLEHDVTKLIYQLANPKKPVVGLMSSLPIDGGRPNQQAMMMGQLPPPWVILEQMRQLFDVRSIDLATETIDEEVDVLMLVHPKNLNDRTLYAIDQFVLRGGRLLLFIDEYAEADQSGQMPGMPPMGLAGKSDLGALGNAWGIELAQNKVAGDLALGTRVQTNINNRNTVVDYPVWMTITPQQMDGEDLVTAQTENLFFATPGVLQVAEKEGLTIQPLVQTTPNAARIDTASIGPGKDLNELLRRYQPTGQPLLLAVRLTGDINTAFPNGKPAVQEQNQNENQGEEEKAGDVVESDSKEHLTKTSQPANIIVIADTDLLQDRFWVQAQNFLGSRMLIPTSGNGNFVINALDNLLGNADLISVRSRGSYNKPFTLVQKIRQEAELKFREKEQELLDKLSSAEQKLVELDQQKGADEGLLLNEAQQQEIARFRSDQIKIRKELRSVRHELHKDEESLDAWIKFANIGLMPIVVGIGGILIGMFKLRRRRRVVVR